MMCQNNIFTEKTREIYSTEDQITQEIFDDDLHEDIQATELVRKSKKQKQKQKKPKQTINSVQWWT